MRTVKYSGAAGRLVFVFLWCFICATSSAAPASRNLLDSLEIKPAEGKTVIRLNFKQALAYQWHHPKSKGRSLTIGMKQLSNRDMPVGFRESITNTGAFSRLVEVILRKEVGKEPVIVVDFAEELAYEIAHEGDFRSLFIIVFDDLPDSGQEAGKPLEQV